MNPPIQLRTFRLVCSSSFTPHVEALLEAQGFRFAKEPYSSVARRLLVEPFPLGASLAAKFGYIYIQDRSSMLPPLALDPSPGSSVLDMCASPGSKTGFLGQLVGKSGFVLGNEPSKNRLSTLRRNLSQLNLIQCATTSYSGDELPLPYIPEKSFDGGWQYIQLDPPCSGWGTVEKNPQVLSLWQGDKVEPLITLQRRLLSHAYDLLCPGGKLVYSTCTTNQAENEDQLTFACDEVGFAFTPLAAPLGVTVEESLNSRFSECLRIATSEEAQGFFVAALTKPLENSPQNEKVQNHFSDRKKQEKKRSKKGIAWREISTVSLKSLESDFFDPSLLPDGKIACVNNVAHFLPNAAHIFLHDDMNWKGFPIGKVSGSGKVKPFSNFRLGMPSLQEAFEKKLPVLQAESPALIESLFSGQSIKVPLQSGVMGLYFHKLPLCLLTIKGSRALLPAL